MHLNPVRAKLLRQEQPLQAYRWSRLPAYLERPRRRPAWLRVEQVLGEPGIPEDSAAGRKDFERIMEERRQQESPEEYGRMRLAGRIGTNSVYRLEVSVVVSVATRRVRVGICVHLAGPILFDQCEGHNLQVP